MPKHKACCYHITDSSVACFTASPLVLVTLLSQLSNHFQLLQDTCSSSIPFLVQLKKIPPTLLSAVPEVVQSPFTLQDWRLVVYYYSNQVSIFPATLSVPHRTQHLAGYCISFTLFLFINSLVSCIHGKKLHAQTRNQTQVL